MNKNQELLKNTIIIFIGKFCTQFMSFLLIPLYTKFLATSDYGYIDLIQTYITLLLPVLILRMDSGVFRFLIDYRNSKDNTKKIISTCTMIIILQALIFIISGYIFNLFINIKYFSYIVINIIAIALSNIFLQVARGLGDNIGYSIASIISAIVMVATNIIAIVVFDMNGSAILLSTAISNISCLIFLLIRTHSLKMIRVNDFDLKLLKSILKYSIPMIPDGLSWWVINVSDRTIISTILNTSVNGIYSVSCKFSNIITSIFQIFNMSWQESASLHINDADKDIFFSGVLNKTYNIFYSICLLLMNNMYIIFVFLIGESYKQAYKFIPILILANLFSLIANTIGGIYIAKKNTKEVAKTTLFAALINIIINVLLIKKIGLYAATISTIISYIALMIYRFVDVKKYVKLEIDYKIFIQSIIIFIVSSIIYHNSNFIFLIINSIISIIYSIYLNFDIIKKASNFIRRKIVK